MLADAAELALKVVGLGLLHRLLDLSHWSQTISTVYMVLAGMFAISFWLLRYPLSAFRSSRSRGGLSLSQVDQFCDRPLLIGHRGCRDVWPENTLAAFQHAYDCGADMIELDVRRSMDGQLWVHHDPVWRRMCGDERAVAATSGAPPSIRLPTEGDAWAQGHCISHAERARGVCRSSPGHKPDRRVPTLEEVLDLWREESERRASERRVRRCGTEPGLPRRAGLLIEFKEHDEKAFQQVHALLCDRVRYPGLRESVWWFSLRESANARLRAIDPGIISVASIRAVARTLLLFYTGLLPFSRISDVPEVFGLPLPSTFSPKVVAARLAQNSRAVRAAPRWAVRGAVALVINAFASPLLMRHMRARGKLTCTLGVNTLTDLALTAALGGSGSFARAHHGALTDRPGRIAEMLRQQASM